jgi:predicted transcriptional regulator YdeE
MAARSFDPSLVQREGFHVVGVIVRTTNAAETDPELSQVGRLWQRFFDENVSRRTPGAVPGLIAGVYSNYERAGEAEYDMVLGPVVTRSDTVPDGLHLVSVPGGRYLAFPVEGMPPTATLEAWSRIDAWFASGQPFRRAFTYDIELYRPGVTEILVSIEPTAADTSEERI